MGEMLKKNRSQFCILVCVLCFVTNIGQTPLLIDNFPTRNVIIPLWILFAAFCVCKNHTISIGNTKVYWLLAAFFALYYLAGSLVIASYDASDLPYTIFLSAFILGVGLLTGRSLTKEDIKPICTSVILSGTIVGVNVFVTYIYGNSLVGRIYSYSSKNSVSQILLTAWVLILILKLKADVCILKKIFYLCSFILLTVTLVGLKSRASLIAIPIIFIWLIVHGKSDKKLRNIVLVILGIVVIYLLINPDFLEVLINEVILGGRESGNLNDVSSGRFDEWLSFFNDFNDKPFLGHGRMKRESLILTSLLEFGIIGGSFILLMACWPLYWSLKFLGKYDEYYLMFSSVAIMYIANSVFEQLAPFGPGVKCFFLWFLIGIRCTIQWNKT